MITLNDIHLIFGQQVVFDGISCHINKDMRIGLVGRNGSGKSTLLKVLAGKQPIDEGSVEIEKGKTIAYLPQEVVLLSDKSIFDETFSTFEELCKLLAENEKLELALHDHDVKDEVVEHYGQVQHALQDYDVEKLKVDVKKMLMGLGFAQERFSEPVATLSVGWRMRVVLAKLLLKKADFYLFDEPTNHLDIVTKDWFLDFLKNSQMGFVLVCHDRYFLDHLCEKTFELELGNGTLYHANYSNYLVQKEEREVAVEAAYERQQKEISKKMRTIERFRAKANKAKMAQSMIKQLEKIERIEIAPKPKMLAFSFPPIEQPGKIVLRVENVAQSFGDKKIFEHVSCEVGRGERVAIVAPNGVGKTTLFNLIAGKLPLQTGRVEFGYHVTSALFEQDQDRAMAGDNTILQEVDTVCFDTETRKLVRKFLGAFLFSGDDVDKKIRVLSGGEKNRVAMVKVLLQKTNLILLDEPTNHLDIQSKEVLLNALQQYQGTILFVSHDRDFLDRLATRIIELSARGVVSYTGNYESYLYQKEKIQQGQSGGSAAPSQPIKNAPTVMEKSTEPNPTAAESTKLSNKEQYERRRESQKLEAKIDRLEKKIPQLTVRLEELEYGSDEFTKIYNELGESKKQLEDAVEQWELLQASLKL